MDSKNKRKFRHWDNKLLFDVYQKAVQINGKVEEKCNEEISPDMLPESVIPRAPSSPSTINPESSASTIPSTHWLIATAFRVAFSRNVVPVSSTSGQSEKFVASSTSYCVAIISRISMVLCGLRVAMINGVSACMRGDCHRKLTLANIFTQNSATLSLTRR